MAVLINGMEMPKSCASCRFNGAYCYAKGDENAHSTAPCPLVPVPPHGKLIDADTLNYTMLYKENWMSGTGVEALAVWKKDIDSCPTIIEAEEGEK